MPEATSSRSRNKSGWSIALSWAESSARSVARSSRCANGASSRTRCCARSSASLTSKSCACPQRRRGGRHLPRISRRATEPTDREILVDTGSCPQPEAWPEPWIRRSRDLSRSVQRARASQGHLRRDGREPAASARTRAAILHNRAALRVARGPCRGVAQLGRAQRSGR